MKLNLRSGIPRYSRQTEWTPEMWLLSRAELAGLEIEPPALMPVVTDMATETAAMIRALADAGQLDRLSAFDVAQALRRPYLGYAEPHAFESPGFSMLAVAERADAITVTVTAPPLYGAPVWATRPMRLRDRLAELHEDAEARYYGRILLNRKALAQA